MAIDNETRRRGATGVGPIPAGSLDSAPRRRQAAGFYPFDSRIGIVDYWGAKRRKDRTLI